VLASRTIGGEEDRLRAAARMGANALMRLPRMRYYFASGGN